MVEILKDHKLLDKRLNLGIEIALQAGHSIWAHWNRWKQSEEKGVRELVTAADKNAEAIITDSIAKTFPEDSIISEESKPCDGNSGIAWIIDPLDGTTNYAHSNPNFCISIGLVNSNDFQCYCGIVYDPCRKELFSASRGKGCYMNGEPIRVSKTARLSDALLAMGYANSAMKNESAKVLGSIEEFSLSSYSIRRGGSIAIDLAHLAAGRLDGFWHAQVSLWDIVAGIVLVEEARGKVMTLLGDEISRNSTNIVASNGLIHDEMVEVTHKIYS